MRFTPAETLGFIHRLILFARRLISPSPAASQREWMTNRRIRLADGGCHEGESNTLSTASRTSRRERERERERGSQSGGSLLSPPAPLNTAGLHLQPASSSNIRCHLTAATSCRSKASPSSVEGKRLERDGGESVVFCRPPSPPPPPSTSPATPRCSEQLAEELREAARSINQP